MTHEPEPKPKALLLLLHPCHFPASSINWTKQSTVLLVLYHMDSCLEFRTVVSSIISEAGVVKYWCVGSPIRISED